MADVSGLVIGAIGLATLFTTCIELFDCFELGKNYPYDYQLACTKLCLVKARLSGWGVTHNLRTPGQENLALRQHWIEERDVVARSLLGIKESFENASLLIEKYKLTPRRSRTISTVLPHRSKEVVHRSRGLGQVAASHSGWTLLRKRTLWAVHDKQKSDNFIEDLSFLIENLEAVTARVEMSSKKQELPNKKSARNKASGRDSLPHSQNDATSKKSTDDPARGSLAGGAKSHNQDHLMDELSDIQRLVPQVSGHVFVKDQNNTKAIGIMGNVGHSNRNHIYAGSQTNTRDGFGVMGDVNAKAAVRLQNTQSHQSRKPPFDDKSSETDDERSVVDSQDDTPEDAPSSVEMSRR